MKKTPVTALIIIVSIPVIWSADMKGNVADQSAIRAAVTRYNDARNAVNAKAMAEFYTDDAQQSGNRGRVIAEGHDALEHRGTDRHVTGTVTRSGEDGLIRLMDVSVMRKQDGKWLIASQA